MHGGLIGPLLGGLYLGAGRALAQVEIARRLAEAGITTPEILAVGWRRSFGFLRKLAIVARAIPAAENLYEAARRGASGPRRRAILDATADLVRAMHEVGFLHADLNVTNLVLGEDREGMRLHVIDLDRGRFVPVVSGKDRVAGLARLRRSYEKWVASSWPLTPREEIRFLRRYCRSEKSLVRDLRARLEAPRRGPRGRRP